MSCAVNLVAYEKAQAIAVPAGAVFRDADGKDYLYVVRTEGQPGKRPVAIGQRTADKVEIVRGLKEGEEILLERPAAGGTHDACLAAPWLFASGVLPALAWAGEERRPLLETPTPAVVPMPAAEEIQRSMDRGVAFLLSDQNPNGSWGSAERPRR